MGASCASNDNLDDQQSIPQHRLEALYTFKLLLLGPGESGKSTVLKQLKSIYNVKPTPLELEECKKALHQNTLECMKVLCDEADMFGYKIGEENKETSAWLQDEDLQYNDDLITPEQAKAIQALFKSKAIQDTFARRDEYWLLDACQYYIDHVERFAEKDFSPDEVDLVMCRIRTTGRNSLETKLKVNFQGRTENEPEKITYEVVDVGGQRNERKKWIKMFSDVKAIIFLVNLAGYNQVLFEDKHRNRMAEALEVFGQITGWRDESKRPIKKKNVIQGSDIFKNVPIYLLLNKKDIFETMIHKVGLNKTFPDYKGANKCDQAIEFIKKKFREKCPPEKELLVWDITGVARFDVKNAFRAIEKDLLKKYKPRIKEEVKKALAEQRKANGINTGCAIS